MTKRRIKEVQGDYYKLGGCANENIYIGRCAVGKKFRGLSRENHVARLSMTKAAMRLQIPPKLGSERHFVHNQAIVSWAFYRTVSTRDHALFTKMSVRMLQNSRILM